MSALDHPSLLVKLITAAETALQMRSAPDPEALQDLAEAIITESEKPVDCERVIGEEVVMFCQAVTLADAHLRTASRKQARPFLQVIGVLLPEARRALEIAFDQRRRPTA